MTLLIIGLVLFLGVHCVRIIAPQWRLAFIERRGADTWKGVYSVASILGFVALIWGYGIAREEAYLFYAVPTWSRSVSLVIVPFALWLVLASQFPAGFLKRITQHPMLWGVLIWSISHLLNNGDSASVLMFGAFLVWAAVDLVSCYRRPRPNPHATGAGPRTHWWPDAVSLLLALVLTVAFVSFLHEWAFGVGIA